jgi:hypothetical protein
MNPLASLSARTKSILILVLTLLLGGVLGAMLNGWLVHQRIDRLQRLRTEAGFTRMMERTIEPRDAAQRDQVRAILERTAGQVEAIQRQRRHEMRAVVDSMRTELRAVLTAEQMSRLERRLRFAEPPRILRGRPGLRRDSLRDRPTGDAP